MTIEPAWIAQGATMYVGDCIHVLRQLAPESVHCCITSPPYWNLRDYGVEGQLGLEATPEEYTAKIVSVFREVRRVLRPEGTLWLNLGDCYYSSFGGGQGNCTTGNKPALLQTRDKLRTLGTLNNPKHEILKPKDLVGIPWRVAFGLQQDGWYLRSDIIWAKSNPMPEPVKDRPTKAHEYLFLLAKSQRYYYDADAIKEPCPNNTSHYMASGRFGRYAAKSNHNAASCKVGDGEPTKSKNKRTVWTLPTNPFPGAHFATYPPKLIEPCILAGCPEGGMVLDPFAGAGTTALVASQHGRGSILIEISEEYAEIARRRIEASNQDRKPDSENLLNGRKESSPIQRGS